MCHTNYLSDTEDSDLMFDMCESFPKNMKWLISLKFNQKYS